ncbi:hypothetical protein L3X07_08125 [Levilactobacillus brevis]|nr:hypothetical protein [Levilactobacillus brevis]
MARRTSAKNATLEAASLAFPQVAQASQQVAQRLSIDQLVRVMTLTLATRGQLAGNLNFQAILEALTLEILTITAR